MMRMIPGRVNIDTMDGPDDEEMPADQNIQQNQNDSDAPIPKQTSILPAGIVAIHGQVIQPDPGIQNNAGLGLGAEEKNLTWAATILKEAFFYNPEFASTQFLIHEHTRENHQQENENTASHDNFVPTARSAMARWAFPILYESLKHLSSAFKENNREVKINELKPRIDRSLPKNLASNYYHGRGARSYFNGPICERTRTASFKAFFWNCNPFVQHAYFDPVLRLPHIPNTNPETQAQALKDNLTSLREKTIKETNAAIQDLDEDKFQPINPARL